MIVTREEVQERLNKLAAIKTAIKNSLSAKGIDMTSVPFTQYHTKIVSPLKWIYGDGSAGDVVFAQDAAVSAVSARTITVTNGATLRPTSRLTPIILRATQRITVEAGTTLNADGYGMVHTDADNNKFGLAESSWNQRGSIGISGGGFTCPGGSCGLKTPGGRAVPVATFLSYIQAHFKELFVGGDLSIIPLFGGGGGGSGEVANGQGDNQYGYGGGCILLVAPEIVFNGAATVRGQAGRGSGSYHGYGGGGGGWIGFFGRSLSLGGTYSLNANGGGGGGYYAGSWSTGGVSTKSPQKYSRGGGGGGSTALNANGGTPGAGGSGAQSNGYAGSTDGTGGGGGGGGDGYGSRKGTGGGAGGGAGKITWLQL